MIEQNNISCNINDNKIIDNSDYLSQLLNFIGELSYNNLALNMVLQPFITNNYKINL
jgi:hypothetical protein